MSIHVRLADGTNDVYEPFSVKGEGWQDRFAFAERPDGGLVIRRFRETYGLETVSAWDDVAVYPPKGWLRVQDDEPWTISEPVEDQLGQG